MVEIKRILVISQYFYPEQFRINDMCKEWIERGYKVTVVTGIPNYPQGEFYKGYGFLKNRKEMYKGIEIIRLPLIPRGKNAIGLILNYLSFVVTGFVWSKLSKIKADSVFIYEVSPMTQALPGVWFADRKNIPCYLYVQDLWPENVEIITGTKNKVVLGSIGKMVDYIYSKCTKIFTTSTSFVQAIKNRGVPMEKIEFWPQYAEDFYKPLSYEEIEEIDHNSFNITFTGNIGEAQGLDILPEVASILSKRVSDQKIKFNIVGDGRYKSELMEKVKNNSVSNMFNFIDRQSATRIPEILAASDAAFLSLTNHKLFEMTIPAKLQSYMACGIPILAAANGESKVIIEESCAGEVSPAGDAKGLAEIIINFLSKDKEARINMGMNAREYYLGNFDKIKLLDRMDTYLTGNTNKGEKKIV